MIEKVIHNNGVELCTESFGEHTNPPVLLSAGATVSMLFWDEDFCRQLADKGFFVIRYDNRDVGKSTHYPLGTTSYDIVDFVDDAIAILDEYNIGKAHLVGMSLGGMVAQIAALKYPERVSTLTLFSTMPWCDSEMEIPEMDKRIIDFQSKALSLDWSNEEEVVEYMIGSALLINGKKPYDKQRGEKYIRAEYKRAKNYRCIFNHAGLQGGDVFYNRMDEIRQPVLIIHGTDDLICHYNHTRTMLDKLKNSKLITLEGTGHEINHLDWPVIINGIAGHIDQNARL